MEQAKTHYEVIVIGAGVAGIYQIKRLADLGIGATVLETGRRPRRNLVLEPLSRLPLRFGELHLRLLVLATNCSTSGTGRSASPASPRTCATSITSPTSSTCASTCSSTARSRRCSSTRRTRPVAVKIDDGRELTCRFVVTRGRPALGADHAAT